MQTFKHITEMESTILICFLSTLVLISANQIHDAVETEMFAIPISPNLFNWTYQEFDQQYRFHASLVGKPELPSWLRYIYSGRHHSGFIFGTPPPATKSPIKLEVIGLNRQDYETRRLSLTLKVNPKDKKARHEVELKIDNLNVEDLLDEHRMARLKEILKTKLWTESNADLYTTFLASAIDLGARLPLRPGDGEGLVVRLGSMMPFSAELKRLREEVRPLSKLPSCPRDYKRTTVERLFRDAHLALDWCSFELYNTIYKDGNAVLYEYQTVVPNTTKSERSSKAGHAASTWSAPSLRALPQRSYTQALAAALAAPVLLALLAIAALTAVLCFHYATVDDPESEYFLENVFHLCIEYCIWRANKTSKVEICRYGTDQTQIADTNSNKSLAASPSNSLSRPYSPKSTTNLASSFNRPQPPPYMGSNTNSLHHRKPGNNDRNTPSTSGHTPEHSRTHLVLEESLKLLNEANINQGEFENLSVPILKDPIIDYADSTHDYISMKPDNTGYIPVNADLDDIDVPELSKYGISTMIGSI